MAPASRTNVDQGSTAPNAEGTNRSKAKTPDRTRESVASFRRTPVSGGVRLEVASAEDITTQSGQSEYTEIPLLHSRFNTPARVMPPPRTMMGGAVGRAAASTECSKSSVVGKRYGRHGEGVRPLDSSVGKSLCGFCDLDQTKVTRACILRDCGRTPEPCS